jgi:hypothetical protein
MKEDEASVWLCRQIGEAAAGWATGKIGTSEFNTICFYRLRLQQPESPPPYPNKIVYQIFVNAGLWASTMGRDETIDTWAKAMIEAVGQLDAVVAWNPMYPQQEDMFLREYARDIPRICSRALEPYYTPKNQYTLAMVAGSIAVVSPFADSITTQVGQLDKIFPADGLGGQMWSPQQTFIPIQAPYGPSMTPEKQDLSWSPEILIEGPLSAVQHIANKVQASGARYAFVGMGCLSLLVVAELKKRGIIALHTGGATQIMFGVKGERWTYHNVISKLFNEHWCRPTEKETPSNADRVEGACYW